MSNALEAPLADRSNILECIETRQVFHEKRDQALTNPENARDKLLPYANLTLIMSKAKGLIASDSAWLPTSKGSSDPYAMAFVDDVESGHTNTINSTTEPEWMDLSEGSYEEVKKDNEIKIPIDTAHSVIQIQVLDEDTANSDDLLGFVEFPVADLPTDGTTVEGWFDLTPKERLQGNASDRIALALQGKDVDGTQESGDAEHEYGKAGSIYLIMKLEIVSGDASDEFYAFCLPPPTFKEYPIGGFKRKHEPMDVQSLVDGITMLQSGILDGFVRPFTAFHRYVFTWKEKWLSAIVCLFACIVAMEPFYLGFSFFFVQGLFLLLLKDPVRRSRMGADPNNAPLSQAGYELMAWCGNGETMTVWLERVVAVMHGKVTNRKRLREFAAFSFDTENKPVTDYMDLKKQLRKAANIGKDDGEEDKKFVEFDTKPLAEGTLIANQSGKLGRIQKCLNPSAKGEWKYDVAFGKGKDPQVQSGIDGDELDARTDLSWMSNQAVLMVIPNSLEDQVNNMTPKVTSLARQVQKAAFTASSIVSWEGSKIPTLYLVLAFWALSGLSFLIAAYGETWIMWILTLIVKIVAVVIVIGVHLYGADFMVHHRVKVHADKDVQSHKDKDPMTAWGKFLTKEPQTK